jgi:ERCC4-type nuclease
MEQPRFEHTYPEGFALVRDTREQTGLFIPQPPKGLMLVIDTLKYGDYSIRGFEGSIAVERKNIDDLWSSVTVDADRFKRELEHLMEYERKWILVEGLESEYLAFRPERKVHPNAVRQALASIEGRMGIPVHQAESQAHAERWILDVFIKYYRMKRG